MSYIYDAAFVVAAHTVTLQDKPEAFYAMNAALSYMYHTMDMLEARAIQLAPLNHKSAEKRVAAAKFLEC